MALKKLCLVTLFASATTQRIWLDDSCGCPEKDTNGQHRSLVELNSWSSCTVRRQDGVEIGCYSGVQERYVQCTYNTSTNLASNELPIQTTLTCTQYKRCMLRNVICNGYWGLWIANGTCDCVTKKLTQRRNCYKKSGGQSLDSPSFHCYGGEGISFQSRDIPCRPKKICNNKNPLRKPIKTANKPTVPSTTATTEQITTQDQTTSIETEDTTIQGKKPEGKNPTEITRNYEMNETTIAIIVGVASGVVIFITGAVCCLKLQKTKLQENRSENSATLQTIVNDSDTNNGTYTMNGLYSPATPTEPRNNGQHSHSRPSENYNGYENPRDFVPSTSSNVPSTSSNTQVPLYARPISQSARDTIQEEGVYWSIEDVAAASSNEKNNQPSSSHSGV